MENRFDRQVVLLNEKHIMFNIKDTEKLLHFDVRSLLINTSKFSKTLKRNNDVHRSNFFIIIRYIHFN